MFRSITDSRKGSPMMNTLNYQEQTTWRRRLKTYSTVELTRLVERNGTDDGVAMLASDELENRFDSGSVKAFAPYRPRKLAKRVRRTPSLHADGASVYMAVSTDDAIAHYALSRRMFMTMVNSAIRIATTPLPPPPPNNITPIGASRRRR